MTTSGVPLVAGLTITGGVDTPSPGVIITDVKEGGAAGIDGFLQVCVEPCYTVCVECWSQMHVCTLAL